MSTRRRAKLLIEETKMDKEKDGETESSVDDATPKTRKRYYYTLKLKVTNCIQYNLFNLFIVLRASQERLKY